MSTRKRRELAPPATNPSYAVVEVVDTVVRQFVVGKRRKS